MTKRYARVLAIFAAIALIATRAEAESKPKESDRVFLTEVKPLLNLRCVSCHGPDKAEGGLRLDTREAALKGGDSGPRGSRRARK